MAMIFVILGGKQRCPNCEQKSSPKVGEGRWEIMGEWRGPIHRCTDCNALTRIGFFSDEMLSRAESETFLAAREKRLRS